MKRFKIGDIVTPEHLIGNGNAERYLVIGKPYTVTRIDDNRIELLETDSKSWFNDRFTMYKPKQVFDEDLFTI